MQLMRAWLPMLLLEEVPSLKHCPVHCSGAAFLTTPAASVLFYYIQRSSLSWTELCESVSSSTVTFAELLLKQRSSWTGRAWMGKGVSKAVENINQHLGPALKVQAT